MEMESAALFMRMLGALLLVLGAIFTAAWCMKRFGVTVTGRRQGGRIELIETRALGPKRHLHLVRCCGGLFLIGSGGDGLSLLSTIREPQGSDFEKLLSEAEEAAEQG